MKELSITEAAKLAGISRQHLYNKYINKGLISVLKENDKSYIELSELLRVFPNCKIDDNSNSQILQVMTPQNIVIDKLIDSKDELIKSLQQQLNDSKDREQWLKTKVDELQTQQNYLLENKTAKKKKKFLGIF